MADYSAATAAEQIYPIVGAGIGLGVIAGTSRAVMDTMYGDRWRPRPRQKMKPRPYYRSNRKPYYNKPYKPRGGPYDWHLKHIKKPRW